MFQKSKSRPSSQHTSSKKEPREQYKSVREHVYSRLEGKDDHKFEKDYHKFEKEYTTIVEPPGQTEKSNMTLGRRIKINLQENKVLECRSCKQKTFEMLKL